MMGVPMRIRLLLFFLFSILAFLPRVSSASSDGASFWVGSEDPFLADWLTTRLTAHGFRGRVAHCASIVIEAKRRVVSTSEGYRVHIHVTFLSMDGTPIGQWKSDPERGLLSETHSYKGVVEGLFDERSHFGEIAEGVAASLPILGIPSRICGSG